MSTTPPLTPIEELRALAVRQAEINIARAQALLDIFSRPAFTDALEELRAMFDPDAPRSPSMAVDVNGQIRAGITALENIPITAAGLIEHLNAVLGAPPVPVEGEPVPPLTPES